MCYSIGWQPSLLARDLTSGTYQGEMNILMNQSIADMQARQYLYMTPSMNFNNYIPYCAPSSNIDYLLNPYFALPMNNINYYSGGWSIYA